MKPFAADAGCCRPRRPTSRSPFSRSAWAGILLLLGAAPPSHADVAEKVAAQLRDLRVFLDFDDDPATFASWPVDKSGTKLPAHQIARGARIGLALWASVLPDMGFRFVQRAEDATLILRFGPYPQAETQGRDGWGQAFMPSQWAERADPDCGRIVPHRTSAGLECGEWQHNIITFYTGRWAVAAADTVGNTAFHAWISWVYDRANPHFRKEGGPCRDGLEPGAQWSDGCVDFEAAPNQKALAGVDLAGVVAHELGHPLLGGHTNVPEGRPYVDIARDTIVDAARTVRLGSLGYSILFPGDEDKWWNRRGMFAADVHRLKAMGYRVSYPAAVRDIVLGRADGSRRMVSDWAEAQEFCLWSRKRTPLTAAEARTQWFVVDVVPRQNKTAAAKRSVPPVTGSR